MWSMGNEPDTEHFPESAYDYWHSLYEFTHSLDPQNRPVTFVCCQNNYEKDIVTRTMDVVCLNRYYDGTICPVTWKLLPTPGIWNWISGKRSENP